MPDIEDDNATPRWVKVFGIIALIVILLFVILLLARGTHGPSRHMRSHSSPTSYSQHIAQQS